MEKVQINHLGFLFVLDNALHSTEYTLILNDSEGML